MNRSNNDSRLANALVRQLLGGTVAEYSVEMTTGFYAAIKDAVREAHAELLNKALPTFGSLLDAWWEQKKGTLVRAETNICKLNKLHGLRERTEKDLTPEVVHGHFLSLKNSKGYGGGYLNQAKNFGSQVVLWAQHKGLWGPLNPFLLAPRLRFEPHKVVTLPLRGWVRAIGELPAEFQRWALFQLLTGLRNGELGGLLKEDVDLKMGVVRVRRSWDRNETKSGKSREIAVTGFMKIILQEAMAGESIHVFTWNGKPVKRNMKLSRIWSEAFESLTLDKLPRVYDLRHAACTGMYESKTQDVVVRAVMGHAPRSMSEERYTHLSVKHQKAELERWSQRVLDVWNSYH